MNTSIHLSSSIGRVLFIDDDSIVLKATKMLLARHGFDMSQATSAHEARAILAAEAFDVILLDLNLSRGAITGAEGLTLMSELIAENANRVLIIVTAHSGVNIAVKAMQLGATDFITKPWRNSRLLEAVQDGVALARRRQAEPVNEVSNPFPPIVGTSETTNALRQLIARAAPIDAPVFIQGPSGSGKALVASHLHAASRRSSHPMIRFDLARERVDAIIETLRAKIAEATGSTLFLTDIETMPVEASGLLNDALDANIRLIVSSLRSLDELNQGSLSIRGLSYKLATIEIKLLPLADRKDDIDCIADYYLRLSCRRFGRPYTPIDAMTRTDMREFDWQGGVNQIIQIVERAVAIDKPISELLAWDAAVPTASNLPNDFNLDRLERRAVENALARHNDNVARAARDLGLSRAALYRRMEKYGL